MIGRTIRWLTEKIARQNKKSFKEEFNISWFDRACNHLPVQIVSFSGEKQLEDQLLSMLSFYLNVGRPEKWILFSDGSHSENSKNLLNGIPGLILKEGQENSVPEKYKIESYPYLKKIFYFRTIDISTTTLFADSDIIFYKPFKQFLPVLSEYNWYNVDERYGYLDTSYLAKVKFDMYPCNSGLLIFNTVPQWDTVLDYLDLQMSTAGGMEPWTEQTAFHVLSRGYKTMLPLDPRYFIVDGSDSFLYRSNFDYNKIAARHFVRPVRHKMWQYSWRKLLDIS